MSLARTCLCLTCRPLTLDGVLKLKAEYPDARLVVGNTEVGIEMKFKDARYPVLVGVTHVPELNNIEVSALPCTVLPQTPRFAMPHTALVPLPYC